MGTYPIFCPSCDTLILDAPGCRACEWVRPNDTAAVGEAVDAGIELPLRPVAGSRPVVARHHIWVTGIERGKGRLVGVNPDTGSIRVHDLPAGHLAHDLSTDGALVFAACGDPAIVPVQGKRCLALDGGSAEVVWDVAHPEAYMLSPAAYHAGSVSYLTDAGELWFRAPASGDLQQRVQVRGSAVRFAPTFAGDLILIAGQAWAADQPALVALHSRSASVVWQLPATDPLVSPPVVGHGSVYVSFADGLERVDTDGGKALWPKRFAPRRITRRGALTCEPAIAAGHVLVGGGDWEDTTPAYALNAIDPKSGTSTWSHRLAARLSLPPVVVDGVIIYADSAGSLVALDPASERPIWTLPLRGKPATVPAITQDYVHAIAQDGHLTRIRYRSRISPPAELPEAYAARQAWEDAAAAYALRGELAEAGRMLLQAQDGNHALRLFEAVGDQKGRARALTMLEEWDAAIQVHAAAGHHLEAAEVQLQAGRPLDAARAFEVLGESARAGAAFATAGALIDAARCYLAAGEQAALQALTRRTDADLALAEWLSETAHWELAINLLIWLDRKPAAARLLQDREQVRRALDLWWELGAWDQCRALTQRLHDKAAEARVAVKQRQYGEAARLYAELNQWEEALRYYELVPSLEGSVSALAGLGRFEEAADRLAAAHRHADAARHYQRAVQRMIEAHGYDRAAAAALFRRAGECFAFDNEKVEAQTCHMAAAKVLSEPVLHLTDVRINSALTVGHESRLQVVVANQGFGPARRVQVTLDGRGYGYEQPTAAGNRIDVLAAGDVATVQAGLTPVVPGPGVELRLRLGFETLTAETQSVGPFQAFLTVQRAAETGPTAIHIGSFEYVGPGGMHAQDVVQVRPTYDIGGKVSAPAPAPGPPLRADQLARSLLDSNISTNAPASFCSRCGAQLTLGRSRCPNPDCMAPLCTYCGSCLEVPGQDCPNCGIKLQDL